MQNNWKGLSYTYLSGASSLKNNVFLLLDCPYGTYGVECRKTCNCKGGICDRETGACLTLPFFAKIASKLKNEPQAGKSAKRHCLSPCLDLFAWFQWVLLLDVCISRFRGGIWRGPEHRPAHFHSSKAARSSLTSNWETEFSVNVALTYQRSANIYFMILNCDKLFYSLTNFSLGYGLDLFLLLFCVLFFLIHYWIFRKWKVMSH